MMKQSDKSRMWDVIFGETTDLFFSKSHYEKINGGGHWSRLKETLET